MRGEVCPDCPRPCGSVPGHCSGAGDGRAVHRDTYHRPPGAADGQWDQSRRALWGPGPRGFAGVLGKAWVRHGVCVGGGGGSARGRVRFSGGWVPIPLLCPPPPKRGSGVDLHQVGSRASRTHAGLEALKEVFHIPCPREVCWIIGAGIRPGLTTCPGVGQTWNRV